MGQRAGPSAVFRDDREVSAADRASPAPFSDSEDSSDGPSSAGSPSGAAPAAASRPPPSAAVLASGSAAASAFGYEAGPRFRAGSSSAECLSADSASGSAPPSGSSGCGSTTSSRPGRFFAETTM